MNVVTVLAFVVSLGVQVALPLGAALLVRRRLGVRWLAFVYGAAVYAVFQLFTWLPLSVYIDIVVGRAITSESWAFAWLLISILATSLVEEVGRYLGYRWLFRRGGLGYSWRNGVMYGLGHGAIETMLLIAGMTFVYMLAYLALAHVDPSALLVEQSAAPALVAELEAIRSTTWSQPLVVALSASWRCHTRSPGHCLCSRAWRIGKSAGSALPCFIT